MGVINTSMMMHLLDANINIKVYLLHKEIAIMTMSTSCNQLGNLPDRACYIMFKGGKRIT